MRKTNIQSPMRIIEAIEILRIPSMLIRKNSTFRIIAFSLLKYDIQHSYGIRSYIGLGPKSVILYMSKQVPHFGFDRTLYGERKSKKWWEELRKSKLQDIQAEINS